MKKLLTLTLVLVFLLSLIPSAFISMNHNAHAQPKNETVVHNISKLSRVGYDWDGVTKLDPPRDVPWQRPGEEWWGRSGYHMPSAVRARQDDTPIPVENRHDNSAVNPVFYTMVYLEVVAEGGTSTLRRPFYVIVDDDMQLWFDQDGYFHDSRYDSSADPLRARSPYEPFFNPDYIMGECHVNPDALIDPHGINNTKGPYFLNPENPFYFPRQFFWDYKKDELSPATNRMWQIGWVDMVDYPFAGAVLGDMTISDGIVEMVRRPDGRVDTEASDWDLGLPVVPFLDNEFHTDQTGDGFYSPGDMNTGQLPDFIYRADMLPYGEVKPGDLRLTPVSIKREEEVRNYPPDTIVQAGDWDIDLNLVNFQPFEKHAENVALNNTYDPGEWIYRLPYDAETVTENAIRLTNVNGATTINPQGIFRRHGTGMHAGDALIMLEVTENLCSEGKNYDVHVLSDVFMGQSPSYAAAKLRSQNGDIVANAQRIQKSTVLDPGLDVNRYKTLPGTTFHNVRYEYREYIGLELFFDNGIDNLKHHSRAQDVILPLDLNDNYREGLTGEQFIGARNYVSTQDIGRRLVPFTENYRYYDAGGDPQNPQYGCGEVIYWLPNPNDPMRQRDTDDNLLVQAGDRRFTDIELDIGGVLIEYQRNTVVTPGDADVGLPLYTFDRVKMYIPNYDKITPDTSAPFEYDPNYINLYYDGNDNGVVDYGDIRLTSVEVNGTVYACGSEVSGGDAWFMESPVNMISVGLNGHFNFMDSYVLPGNIGLNVEVDPPLMVEQTSTVTVSVDPPPAKDEKVYVSLQSPKANEFNLFRQHVFQYNRQYEETEYITTGKNMEWYGVDRAWGYELPFEFPYLGRNYRKVFVSSNGFINFTQNEPIARPLDQFDARLMVYGDALRLTRPDETLSISNHVATTPFVNNTQNQTQGIYISYTNDSITIRWRAQTQYTVSAGAAGSYQSNGGLWFGLVDAQVTLFENGNFTLNYMVDMDVPDPIIPGNELYKLYNRVNNIHGNGIIANAPIVGITDGMGFYEASPVYNGLKNMAIVDGLILGNSYVYAPRLRFFAAEVWLMVVLPFNEPHAVYPRYNEQVPYEDFVVLTHERPTATFQYTPYRGTARETGVPEWVEIRAYKDKGGSTVAPPDSTYTYLPNLNYADPTVWTSRWTRTEHWQYPWGEFQKTRWFVYPPTRNLIPRELSGTYDCFGIDRLEIAPEPLDIKPSRTCVSILDERQPIVTLEVSNWDNPLDVNDPHGMAVASTRRTVPYQGLEVDFGLVLHPPAGAPAGSHYIQLAPGMVGLFRVGDYVYIETGLPTPMYRRVVAISGNQLWFDLPIHVGVPNGSQVVQNALIANYNVFGAGINGMFTTIGSAGQRYIVQVRDDGRYDFWRWYEPLVPNQVRGVVDPTDWFYSWQDMFCPDRNDNSVGNCRSTTLYRIPYPMVLPRPALGLEDMDCSLGDSLVQVGSHWPGFPRLGEWSYGDRYGIFGNNVDPHWAYPNGIYVAPPQAFGPILTWGVPTLLTPKTYPTPTDHRDDDGGKATIVAWPTDPSTPMNIKLYTTSALFDYNSTLQHPGHYILEPGMGINYVGEVSIDIAPSNPDVNFTDMSIIDHGLKNSRLNYTSGDDALYPLEPPNPQIGSRYFPMATDFNRDIRAYPGGQSHAGRVRMNFFNREHISGSAWNAYPAIWRDKYVKLGTEFMPQTDYGLAFYLKGDNPYNYLSFINGITRIVVKGPFATPKKVMEDQLWGSPTTAGSYGFRLNARYEFEGYENVPLHYDFSGVIEVDNANRQYYEIFMPNNYAGNNVNFALATNPTAPFDAIQHQGQDLNPWLVNNFGGYDHRWSYFGVGRYLPHYPIPPYSWQPNNVFLFDELIPIGHGDIEIEVDYMGDTYTFTNCCEDPYMTALPVHGITIDGAPQYLEIEQDHELRLTLTESTRVPDQETQYSNNALLMVWQDRGILDPLSGNLIGMGDGHITNPPRASSWHEVGKQFAEHHDLNRDGKISFEDFETEVMGTYDLATNTWSSGVIDGRTFMRNQGEYRVNLSAANGSQLTTIGYDFGGMPTDRFEFDKEPDHIISKYESLPIYINAYKYGDDNSDRGFTPLWRQIEPYEYSHEVYLSGMAKIEPAPVERLIVTTSPDVITAGATPELIDPEHPLSFTVMDDQGNPVNLFHGVEDDRGNRRPSIDSVHNLLFYDPHPNEEDYFGRGARLPDYYWIRTDLHNFDGTLYDNNSIYMSTMAPFNPISVDFNDADQGLYRFFGFTANDAGYFVVRVYTPDRRSYGDTVVNVSLPDVHYTIINDEDPMRREHHVPGDPDFVMTALDLRSYTITAQVYDAQGRPLRGFRGEEDCEAVPARFTPFSTYVRNLEYRSAIMTEPYYNMLGYDRNNNGRIDLMNRERLNMAGFTFNGVPVAYYTGILRHPLYEGFRLNPIYFPVRDDVEYYGMGLGAIYNSRHYGTLLFADIDATGRADEDKKLTFADSLILDEEGKVTFKVYLNDLGMFMSNIGGLVGLNALSINPQTANIYGYPNYNGNPFAPFDVWKRYRYTGKRFLGERASAFQLDWDAHASRSIEVNRPQFELLNASTRKPLSRDLLDEYSYDLRYGIENHLIIRIHQADSRDLPIKDIGEIYMQGARDEEEVRGKIAMGPDGIPEAAIRYTPTGTGIRAGYINYYVKNQGFAEFSDHITLGLFQLVNFDSVNSLAIEIVSVGQLTPKVATTLRLRVVEAATRGPVAEARVRIRGAGINENTRTNELGITEIEITPDREGEIEIEASRINHLNGTHALFVGRDTRPLFLHIDTLPELTNQPTQTIRGYTKTHSRVWVNDREALVDEAGKFEQMVMLEEGSNEIIVQAKDEMEEKEEKITIILDTQAPVVTLHDPGTLVDVTEAVLRGTLSKPANVTVNGTEAQVIGTNWQLNIPVNYGKNILNINAKDKAGNESSIEKEVYVYQRWVIEIQIGSNSVYLNGIPQPPLSAPPYIKDGHTMVPIRLIAETFDAEVQWREAAREIIILLEGKIVIMRIGASEATVNGIPVELSVPPEIVAGTTFIPLRFITEAFEFEVEWIASTRTIRIIKLV